MVINIKIRRYLLCGFTIFSFMMCSEYTGTFFSVDAISNQEQLAENIDSEQEIDNLNDGEIVNYDLPKLDNDQIEQEETFAVSETPKSHNRNIVKTIGAWLLIIFGVFIIIKVLIDSFNVPKDYAPGYIKKYSSKNRKRKKYNIKF